MNHIMDAVKESMGGMEHEKPKKEVKEIRTRRGKSGGYIHEHHHSHPESHPPEEHISPDEESMVSHMMGNMGQPNPEAGAADAGQSGTPMMPQAGAQA